MKNFRTLSKIALVLIYLVIIAGSVVRMTGSGMGCPDWPKCFGYYIPPTHESQLLFRPNHSYEKGMMILLESEQFMVAKKDFISNKVYDANNWELYSTHDYAIYNPVHTWTEYINRLIGAFSGLPILILGIWSLWFFNKNKWITVIALLTLFGMGFQAWLGKTVVDSNLAPYKITIHMVMALLIVAFVLYLIFATKTSFKLQKYHSFFYTLLVIGIVLTLIQIVLGTQVRQFVDEQTKMMGYEKSLWLAQPELDFYVHRSTSILVLVINGYLWFINKKLNLGYKKINLVLNCILLEVFSGIMMYYFDFPFLSQPLHLVIASILFGIQMYILLEILHQKRMINKTIA
ncbi:MAG: COX15/CtaA family protein [Flavobacteriaceae bacterium]|jgi:cytochrome c oxidase assembly protein subunit 15